MDGVGGVDGMEDCWRCCFERKVGAERSIDLGSEYGVLFVFDVDSTRVIVTFMVKGDLIDRFPCNEKVQG